VSPVHYLLPKLFGTSDIRIPPSVTTIVIGLATMLFSISLHGSVVSVALSSISLIGAGLAAAVMIKVMNWRHSAASLLGAITAGVCSAIIWKQLGMSGYFNEAGIGMTVGLAANFIIAQRVDVTKTKIQTI
jgi:hypothetical protein